MTLPLLDALAKLKREHDEACGVCVRAKGDHNMECTDKEHNRRVAQVMESVEQLVKLVKFVLPYRVTLQYPEGHHPWCLCKECYHIHEVKKALGELAIYSIPPTDPGGKP